MAAPVGWRMVVNMQGGDILPHIYINGWRRSQLAPVWQGSPRPAPALAVAVAPLAKGNKPILAVLESSDKTIEKAPGKVSLWQWTGGFGFELAALSRRLLYNVERQQGATFQIEFGIYWTASQVGRLSLRK